MIQWTPSDVSWRVMVTRVNGSTNTTTAIANLTAFVRVVELNESGV